MIARIFLLILVSVFLLACSEEKQQLFKKRKADYQPFVIKMQHYFSDSEEEVSFPLWFEDSLIVKHKIKTIKRKIYRLNEDKLGLVFPKTEKIYTFDKKGGVTQLQIIDYYEGEKVNDVTFRYTGVKDKRGFQVVEYVSDGHLSDDADAYAIYQKEMEAKNFLAYRNQEDGNFLFYVTNKAHWGALSVDSILQPTPDDIIVLGTPKKPTKKYSVENRVNEFNVNEIDYRRKTSHVEEMRFEKNSFNYRRTLVYSKKGFLDGFVDSTFSLDQYLMRRKSTFTCNKKHLPTKLSHTSQRTAEEHKNSQIETFEYTYYD